MKNFTKNISKIAFFTALIFCITTKGFATNYSSSSVQQYVGAITAGTNNNPILRVNVTGSGGGTAASICSMQFTMQNTNNADISNARLYYTSTVGFATTNLLATVANPTGTITFNFSQAIGNSTYYFHLAYDIKATAANCNSFDAFMPTNSIAYINAASCPANASATPTTPNPAGERVIEAPGCWNYCSSNASATTYSYISNVTFNTINNSSATCTDYTDFTAISTVVNPSSSYNLTITKTNTCTGTTPFTGRFAAWIDWNNDGVFGAGEQVLTDAAASNGPVTVSVTVPAGATIGTTRMRCIFIEGATVPPVCGAYSTWGETEDYSIIIATLVNCSGTPTAGTITPATSTITTAQSVNLNWSQLPQAGMVYQWQSASSATGPWSNVSGATSFSYTASGLSAGSHFFRLIITCTNSGLSATSATASVTVTLVYCASAALNCTPNFTGGCGVQYLVIRNVTLGTLNNNSSATTCDAGGNSDFTSLAAPNLNIGQSYNLSITVGATSCGTNTAMVWFDFNQNGDFGDAGEAFAFGTVASNATVTIPIVVPTTASIGNTRMRIKYLYNSQILSSWHCYDNSGYGETEDYMVNLQCTPTPSDIGGKFPANGMNMACGSAAILGWNPHTCATGFKVYLGTTNPPTTLVSTQTATTFYTGNLASNTTYYWRIVPYSSNGDGASSVWSFNTNTAINTAISQNADGCSDLGVTLTASGGAFPDYFWYNVPFGGAPVATGTTFSPTGLTSPTTFYVSNVLSGPNASIDASATGGVVCSNVDRGWGNMFDIQAKTANLTITGVSVMFRNNGTNPTSGITNRPVKVYYRQSSYAGNGGSAAGWILLDNFTVAVANAPTAPTYINSTDFFIPAGMTYSMYVVYDQEYASSPGLFANADLELRTGTSICGSEFGTVINDRTFRGTVFYNTSCSSPTIPVVASPWVSSAQIKLAPATITGLVERCTESGWTYYSAPSVPNDWLFAINKNGNVFTATVDITKQGSVYSNINAPGQHGSFLLPRFWNVNLTSGSINPAQPVGVRFFVDTAEIRATVNARELAHATSYSTTFKTAWRWFKSEGIPFNFGVNIDGNIFNFNNMTPTVVNNMNIANAPYTGFINNVAYVQLGGITSFSGGTGGVGFTPDVGGVLPIELLSFQANESEKFNKLDWSTITEKNNDFFIVESSKDGFDFVEIGKLKGGANSNQLLSYTFNDYKFYNPLTYYRLKQVDFDKEFSYSSIVAVDRKLQNINKVNLYPNPSDGRVTLNVISSEKGIAQIKVVNSIGQVLFNSTITIDSGQNLNDFDLSDLPPGFYILELSGLNEKSHIKFTKR
ncbi:MAG: GEVED domain-containing protein [Bacteroidota bacterium]|nr:GEVED domain-containing protein [Bacteroidota bacterium]